MSAGKKKFNFQKIHDIYYLFLVTTEMNIEAFGEKENVEDYEDLYNDIIYDIPYKLFMKKLKKYSSLVTFLDQEHEKDILFYFKEVLDILPYNTKRKIEKIISAPFEYKRMRKEKKLREGLTVKIIKEFFKEN